MATLRIEKVDISLPVPLTANTLYYVKNGLVVESYISDGTGTTAFKVSGITEEPIHSFLLMGASNG